ncbi:MAG: AIR synthase-related protein [Candidatus Thalassarchaeaceae archaeon]|jgi:phosphoribosylformylglycinamidine synthase|nr:AIR synthase-related protein [Euryarchaeota archaeon]MDC3326142.1 AIR synthase-related protein [Euryarchaeota archaeon]MDG1554265.1 AIR synthase-related protein [Candidatus Thalassarchaeaceae archaeon]
MEIYNFEVTTRDIEGLTDARGDSVKSMLESDYGVQVNNVRVILGYQVKSDMSLEQATRSIYDLFADPIIEVGNLENSLLDNKNLFSEAPQIAIKVGFKPGVTDNAGQAGLDGLRTIFPEISSASQVATAMTYLFWGVPGDISPNWLSSKLHNQMIERSSISDSKDCQKSVWPSLDFPERPKLTQKPSATVNLEVSDEELIQISEKGLLALNLEEMKAIQENYRDPKVRAARVELGLPEKAPTDAELECLAQTWSEHCCHKIFASKIHHVDFETGEDTYIDSLFKTHIMKPTLDIQSEVNWLLSIFHDNSGVIAWNDDWSLCIKAETHNSPSALDPFGGAMTGIVGVNRDILGTGLGARPIANTDVFCFGPPDYSGHIPEGLFHPSRVFRGVHAGVRAGGNESGIPTVNGSIVFDERYLGKPLVYCGTVGIMPRLLPDGRESHEKTPQPGNIIYMVGGRVGSDGIHGATFSSLELTEDSPSSAVQIGDPITQKKMIDMVLEARDLGLIQVITDNGAGGLSSSVGELAELTGGADLDLAAVPLKQPGLSKWEILVSESQERMTIGVNPEDCEKFEKLAQLHEVEATAVGTFTDSGAFVVRFGDETVAHLPISFLHDGCPQLQLESEWQTPEHDPILFPTTDHIEMGEVLSRLMARPNVASKEWWVRSYDHEVIAQSVIKPFCGVNHDAPGDAAVIAPIQGGTQGAVISNGIVPRYSDIDAYAMAAASIDEALRNAVCVGVDLDLIAGLDNFCWPDPVESAKTPDGRYKLAQLVRANRALDEVCRAYNLPCISGKDSMKNDATLDGKKISVPPTLLFSLIGNHSDVRKAVSSDFKKIGDKIYLVGETHQELGASELAFMLRDESDGVSGIGGQVPQIDTGRNLSLYRSLTDSMSKGLVSSAHDCSDAGLAAAVAECCFGCDSGANLDLSTLFSPTNDLDSWGALFGESLGRILVSVSPENAQRFEESMNGHECNLLGIVNSNDNIIFTNGDEKILSASMSKLRNSWKGTLYGGRN